MIGKNAVRNEGAVCSGFEGSVYPVFPVLPKNLILALLISVITAKTNAKGRFKENYELNIWGQNNSAKSHFR